MRKTARLFSLNSLPTIPNYLTLASNIRIILHRFKKSSKKGPGFHLVPSYFHINQDLADPNSLCARSLGAIDQLEFNALAFLQLFKAGVFNSGSVKENIVAIFGSYESETLGGNKLFDRSLGHPKHSLRKKIWS